MAVNAGLLEGFESAGQFLEALTEHFSPLTESGLRQNLELRKINALGLGLGNQMDDRRHHLWWGCEGRTVDRHRQLGLTAPLRQYGEAAISAGTGFCDDPVGDLALEHQGQRLPLRRPLRCRQPLDEQRRADIIGQVGNVMKRPVKQAAMIKGKRIVIDQFQLIGKEIGQFRQGWQAALVAFNSDYRRTCLQ